MATAAHQPSRTAARGAPSASSRSQTHSRQRTPQAASLSHLADDDDNYTDCSSSLLAPGSAIPTTPPPMSRASSRSTSANMQWHVGGAGAVTGAAGGVEAGGEAALRGSKAETALSSLYATDGAPPAPEETHSEEPKAQGSWGASIAKTALTATVFSAAVGLTAYRLWTGGWNSTDPRKAPEKRTPPRTPDLPPAYESVAHSAGPSHRRRHLEDSPKGARGHNRAQSHHAAFRPPPASPTTSVRSMRSRAMARRKRTKRPSIAALIAVAGRADRSQPATPITPTDMLAAQGVPPPTPVDLIEDDEDEDEEWSARLDEMTRRIQGLISEGQAALDAKASPTTSTTSLSPDIIPRTLGPAWDDLPAVSTTATAGTSTAPSSVATTRPASALDSPSRPSSALSGMPSRPNSSADQVSLGYGHPGERRASTSQALPGPANRPQLRSASSTSTRIPSSSRMFGAAVVPPLPWRREADAKWVQRAPSPGAITSGPSSSSTSHNASLAARAPTSPPSRIPRAHTRTASGRLVPDPPDPEPNNTRAELRSWRTPAKTHSRTSSRTSLNSITDRGGHQRTTSRSSLGGLGGVGNGRTDGPVMPGSSAEVALRHLRRAGGEG